VETAAAVSPEDVLGSVGHRASCGDCQLESKVETAPEHSKVISRSIDHTEAQIVGPTDMPRDSEFDAGSELAEHFSFATEVVRLRIHSERVGRTLRMKGLPFAAAENRADTGPRIGR
jgi:hypothetical protein